MEIPNPFLSEEATLNPRPRKLGAPVVPPEDGRIDCLIKVWLNYSKKLDTQPIGSLQALPFSKPKSGIARPPDSSSVGLGALQSGLVNPMEPVMFLLPDFGRGLRLKPMDEKLFNFCT